MQRDFKVLGRRWGVRPEEVRAPTLIWHGTEDRVVPVTHSEFFARKIAGARRWRRAAL